MSRRLKPKYVPNIPCPHCKAKINVGEIEGVWLSRTCPECGKPLSPEAYDRYALQLFALHQARRKKAAKERDLAKRHKTIAELIKNPLLRPLCFLLERNASRHLRASEHTENIASNTAATIDQTAKGRYYSSEWYLCSKRALKCEDDFLGNYELVAKYTNDGKFFLKHVGGGRLTGGIIGEWSVFEALSCFIRKKDYLKNSRLVPNVFLPTANPRTEGLADEADLAVNRRQAGYQRREEHGRKRDDAKVSGTSKSKKHKMQRYAHRQRAYEIDWEYDEWDYLSR